MALSDKEKLFCRLVAVEKLKQGPAAAQAFDIKANSADTKAWRLMKKAEIQAEIQRLSSKIQQKAENVCVWTKVQRQEQLQEWALRAVEAGELNTAIRAVDLLNKMDGAYVQEERVSAAEVGDEELRRAILGATSGRGMVKN